MVNRLCRLGNQWVTHWFTMSGMELSITDAALTLGISPNTVRRRLTSGMLTGTKVGGKWLVSVEGTELHNSMPPSLGSTALVEHLEARISAQDAELSAMTVQINQLRGLLAEGALKAVDAAPRRHWWRFWR